MYGGFRKAAVVKQLPFGKPCESIVDRIFAVPLLQQLFPQGGCAEFTIGKLLCRVIQRGLVGVFQFFLRH